MTMAVNQSLLEMALQAANALEKQAFTPAPPPGGAPAPDPAAGGIPPGGAPMDPSMMSGGMPPGAGGMPMDPSMMGGAPPMDPSMMGGGMPPGGAAPGMGGDGKPKKVDPAIIDAKLYQILKLQVLICGHLSINIPPELLLGVAPDPMAAQQAASSNQQLETQAGQTTAGLPQGGGDPAAAGGMPKTGEFEGEVDDFAADSEDVRIGSVYDPQQLLDTAMLADATLDNIKEAHATKPSDIAGKLRAVVRPHAAH